MDAAGLLPLFHQLVLLQVDHALGKLGQLHQLGLAHDGEVVLDRGGQRVEAGHHLLHQDLDYR